jgi:hypothetical protein
MNDRTPKSIRDLHAYIESVPFGTVDMQVKRVDRRTVQISTTSEETLRYVDNEEALRDLQSFLSQLTETDYTGEAQLKLTLKNGQISLISIFNTKNTTY